MLEVKFVGEALDEFTYFVKDLHNTKVIELLKDIRRNGYIGIGKPEALKGDFKGKWSRRIDHKNRIIYEIVGDLAIIHKVGEHYNDR
jgi:toxin YoeB